MVVTLKMTLPNFLSHTVNISGTSKKLAEPDEPTLGKCFSLAQLSCQPQHPVLAIYHAPTIMHHSTNPIKPTW